MRQKFEPLLFGIAALALYFCLAADSFYKTDGIDIIRLLEDGSGHPWHVGYLPALALFRWLLSLIGLSPDLLLLGAWFSAVGASLGVGFARAGMRRLEMADGVARLATVLFALSPAMLTFATVVEFHGPMLAPLGLLFWWTTVQIKDASRGGMILLGALCHLPFLIHSQQLFLPVWLLAFFLARRGLTRPNVQLAVLAGVVHGGLILLLPRLLPGAYGFWSDLSTGLETEASIGRPQSLSYAPQIFWQEWLWPLLPLSVLAFTAYAKRSLRREFLAFAIGVVPFLYLSVRQLVFEPEFGAYMLPMTLPAAMLAAQRLGPRWWFWAVPLLGLYPLLTGPWQHLTTQRDIDSTFAMRVQKAAAKAEPYVLVGSHRQLGSAYARFLPEQFLWVRPNATLPRQQVTPRQFAVMELFVEQLLAEGKAVLITDSAIRSLEDPKAAMLAENPTLTVPENDEVAGPLFAAHLRAKFDLVSAGGWMWRLVPK